VVLTCKGVRTTEALTVAHITNLETIQKEPLFSLLKNRIWVSIIKRSFN
jgi:hypothetical protein